MRQVDRPEPFGGIGPKAPRAAPAADEVWVPVPGSPGIERNARGQMRTSGYQPPPPRAPEPRS